MAVNAPVTDKPRLECNLASGGAPRGLERRAYTVRDYENGRNVGTVQDPVASLGVRFAKQPCLGVRFAKHLLLEASPRNGLGSALPRPVKQPAQEAGRGRRFGRRGQRQVSPRHLLRQDLLRERDEGSAVGRGLERIRVGHGSVIGSKRLLLDAHGHRLP